MMRFVRTRGLHRLTRVAAIALVALAPARAHAQPAAPASLPAFRVRDQFDRTLDRQALAGAPVLVVVAGRAGADAAERWEALLRAPARARGVRVVSVADLKGAPRLLRGVIRGSFPKDTARAVLMDFDGQLGRPLRGERPPLVAVAYGADGRLRRTTELPLDAPDAALGEQLIAAALRP